VVLLAIPLEIQDIMEEMEDNSPQVIQIIIQLEEEEEVQHFIIKMEILEVQLQDIQGESVEQEQVMEGQVEIKGRMAQMDHRLEVEAEVDQEIELVAQVLPAK